MDRYEIGHYVRRWTQFDGDCSSPISCRVIDPQGWISVSTTAGSVVRHAEHGYFWHMIAGRVGPWRLEWPANARPVLDSFEVVEDLSVKNLPSLTDSNLTLVPLAPEHLELVRAWRNRDDIRCWFFHSGVISAAEQREWYYASYLPDPGDLMWVAHLNGAPVGTGALTHVDLIKREGEWARLIIGDNAARGKGVAHRIAALVRDYGLDALHLERIYGSLYTANRITLHIDMTAGYRPYREEGAITHVQLFRKDWRP